MSAHTGAVLVFLVSLAIGVYTDIRDRRVANTLVLWLLLLATIAAFWGVSPVRSPLDALLGALTGLALWLPFWLLGLLGAGDVKYFAAGAAWIGVALTWRSALLAALIGGGMAIAVMMWRIGFRKTLNGVALQARHAGMLIENAAVGSSEDKARTFPYALPMAIALGAAALFPDVVLHLGQ